MAAPRAKHPKAQKRALITGVTGQDGSYLAESLLEKGYEVHGLMRRASTFNTERIDHLIVEAENSEEPRFFLHYGDMSDSSNLNRVLSKVTPDEIYHLAAQSHVRVSFDMPEYTADVTGVGTLRLLDAMRETGLSKARFYQASSSEMFGKAVELPLSETSAFHPRSPYGVSKVFGYWTVRNYRESYDMHATNGILFNHESPRRGPTFVTRKITRGLARIALGKAHTLQLGNLDAKRDWGYAKDFVEGMWMMLQQEKPDDYVLATGESHTVREFVEEAAKYFDITIEWKGSGTDEKGFDSKSGKTVIEILPRLFRPAEVDVLIGDCGKAERALGWKPKVLFKELVSLMAKADFEHEKNLPW